MKRLLLIGTFVVMSFIFLLLQGETALAGGGGTGEQGMFHWDIQWGQQDSTGFWSTKWYARSFFTDTVMAYTYFSHNWISTGVMTETIGPEGVLRANYGADPDHIYSPYGFQLVRPGATQSMAGAYYDGYNCLPGPEFLLELNEFPSSNDSWMRLVIRNTTSKKLYLAFNGNYQVTVPLVAGDWYTYSSIASEEVRLLMDNSNPQGSMCARLFWTLPERTVGQTPTVQPSVVVTNTVTTPTPIFTPVPMTPTPVLTPSVEVTQTVCPPGFTPEVYGSTVVCVQNAQGTQVPNQNTSGTPTATTPTPTPMISVSIPVSRGWSNVGVPDGLAVPYTASFLLAEMTAQGLNPDLIARWENGAWQTHIKGFPGNDFPIDAFRGYFVRSGNSGIWRPGIWR